MSGDEGGCDWIEIVRPTDYLYLLDMVGQIGYFMSHSIACESIQSLLSSDTPNEVRCGSDEHYHRRAQNINTVLLFPLLLCRAI